MAVIIEVEKGDPAAHGFGQQLFSIRAIVVNESNAGGRSNINKPDRRDFGLYAGRRNRRGHLSDLGGRGSRLSFQKKNCAANNNNYGEQSDQGPADGVTNYRVVVVD